MKRRSLSVNASDQHMSNNLLIGQIAASPRCEYVNCTLQQHYPDMALWPGRTHKCVRTPATISQSDFWNDSVGSDRHPSEANLLPLDKELASKAVYIALEKHQARGGSHAFLCCPSSSFIHSMCVFALVFTSTATSIGRQFPNKNACSSTLWTRTCHVQRWDGGPHHKLLRGGR
jgi:hypothetical protein